MWYRYINTHTYTVIYQCWLKWQQTSFYTPAICPGSNSIKKNLPILDPCITLYLKRCAGNSVTSALLLAHPLPCCTRWLLHKDGKHWLPPALRPPRQVQKGIPNSCSSAAMKTASRCGFVDAGWGVVTCKWAQVAAIEGEKAWFLLSQRWFLFFLWYHLLRFICPFKYNLALCQ